MDPFYRDTWVDINLDRIHSNVSNIIQHAKKSHDYKHVYAVVKANAYGHGDLMVAQTALEAGATHLAVTLLDEAIRLRKAFKKVPILVLGPVRVEDLYLAAKYNIMITIYDYSYLLNIIENYQGKQIKVHLKIDTGMSRLGIKNFDYVEKTFKLIKKIKLLKIVGLFTHFASADLSDSKHFDEQYQRLLFAISKIDLSTIESVHFANSASILRFPELFQMSNGFRIGISMYGLKPSLEYEWPFPLQQAFSLHTKVTQIKMLNPGETVSYGGTYTAESKQIIATLPIGYADGWIRKNQGRHVDINNQSYPIIGRVCMGLTMVLIDAKIQPGDVVSLINDRITVDDVAKDLDTINYEITCSISERVPRKYYRNGTLIDIINSRFKK